MLIVGIEYDVLACGEQATCIESGGAPFLVLALVIWFDGNIRDELIGADRKSSLNRQFVLIALSETAIDQFGIDTGFDRKDYGMNSI